MDQDPPLPLTRQPHPDAGDPQLLRSPAVLRKGLAGDIHHHLDPIPAGLKVLRSQIVQHLLRKAQRQ